MTMLCGNTAALNRYEESYKDDETDVDVLTALNIELVKLSYESGILKGVMLVIDDLVEDYKTDNAHDLAGEASRLMIQRGCYSAEDALKAFDKFNEAAILDAVGHLSLQPLSRYTPEQLNNKLQEAA